MDYEKKYKNALEWARKVMQGKVGFVRDEVLELFPELKESEDERIRKALVELVKCNERSGYTLLNNISTSSMLAWLEKQGEDKHLELRAGKWYMCYRAYCCRADHLTVKEGERILCEKDGVVKGFVIKDAEKYFKECNAPAPYEDEQKPKWTEEDEKNWRGVIDEIEANKSSAPDYDVKTYDRFLNWLRTLKQRLA